MRGRGGPRAYLLPSPVADRRRDPDEATFQPSVCSHSKVQAALPFPSLSTSLRKPLLACINACIFSSSILYLLLRVCLSSTPQSHIDGLKYQIPLWCHLESVRLSIHLHRVQARFWEILMPASQQRNAFLRLVPQASKCSAREVLHL